MDKNFFTFDIDDEILKSENDDTSSQKVQNDEDLAKKLPKNENLTNIFISNRAKVSKNGSYEKSEGLSAQRKIKSNINDVDDLVNFDFKAKEKIIAAKEEAKAAYEMAEKLAKLKSQMEADQEVASIIEKAHIGVIFY